MLSKIEQAVVAQLALCHRPTTRNTHTHTHIHTPRFNPKAHRATAVCGPVLSSLQAPTTRLAMYHVLSNMCIYDTIFHSHPTWNSVEYLPFAYCKLALHSLLTQQITDHRLRSQPALAFTCFHVAVTTTLFLARPPARANFPAKCAINPRRLSCLGRVNYRYFG